MTITIDKELGIEIGTEEEAFITAELKAAKEQLKSIEKIVENKTHEKMIQDTKWLISLFEKRLKELENET